MVLAVAIALLALAGQAPYSVGAAVNRPLGVDPYANVPTGQAQAGPYGPGGGQTGISHPEAPCIGAEAPGGLGGLQGEQLLLARARPPGTSWLRDNFRALSVGGTILFDLSHVSAARSRRELRRLGYPRNKPKWD